MSEARRENKFQKVVQPPLIPEVAEKIESLVLETEGLLSWLENLAGEGYKFSSTYDFKREQFSASLFGYKTRNANDGFMLYGNAPTFAEAIAVLYVKHHFCCADSVWESSQAQGSAEYS